MKQGWETKKLADIGEIQTGTTPPTKNKEYYGDFIPFIKPPHFNKNGTLDYSNVGLSEIGLTKGRLIEKNSVLMVCIGASIGKTGLNSIPVSCNQQINTFTPNDELCPKFFYYLMSSPAFFNKVIESSSQATLPMINKTKWQNLVVKYPKSLKEQKQIVAILDEAFEVIDQAQANIEKNIENAQELFQSKLNDIFSQKGDDWEEKILGDLSFLKSGGTPLTSNPSYWADEGIAWYSSGELNDTYTKEPERYITNLGLENSNAKVFPKGSLLIGMYDTAALKMSIIDRDATFNQAIVGVEPNNDIDLNFVMLSIQSQKSDILKLRRGVRQKNLNQTKIKAIKIHLPKLSIQKDLVSKINEVSLQLNILEDYYFQKLTNLEELKKSILEKAFAGKLTNKER